MARSRTSGALAFAAAALLVATGCGVADGEPAASPSVAPSARPDTGTADPSGSTASGTPSVEPSPTAPSTAATPEPEPAFVVSDGEPRDALLSIPELGLREVEVRTYRGFTDDAPGHAIQNTGIAASPHGPRGGTGPGGVGNYQVTAHRTSSTRLFEFLPDLRRGDVVKVVADDTVYVYEVRTTRITSFREPESLREQRAAVPGRPGVEPTRAMITLSTCRTMEDHAEGNYWSDQFDNPEHRIDKIGVLVRTRPA